MPCVGLQLLHLTGKPYREGGGGAGVGGSVFLNALVTLFDTWTSL